LHRRRDLLTECVGNRGGYRQDDIGIPVWTDVKIVEPLTSTNVDSWPEAEVREPLINVCLSGVKQT